VPPYYFGYRQSQRGSICQWDTKGIAKTFGVLTSLPANPIARQTPQFPGLVLFVVFVALICGAAQGRDWVGCPRTDCEFAILSSQLRLPLFLIFAVVLVPVLQLVALPPGLWTILPGRVEVAEAYKAAGVSLPFLPVSLEPLTTLRTVLSLLLTAGDRVPSGSAADLFSRDCRSWPRTHATDRGSTQPSALLTTSPMFAAGRTFR
jgi:hypothetical protein